MIDEFVFLSHPLFHSMHFVLPLQNCTPTLPSLFPCVIPMTAVYRIVLHPIAMDYGPRGSRPTQIGIVCDLTIALAWIRGQRNCLPLIHCNFVLFSSSYHSPYSSFPKRSIKRKEVVQVDKRWQHRKILFHIGVVIGLAKYGHRDRNSPVRVGSNILFFVPWIGFIVANPKAQSLVHICHGYWWVDETPWIIWLHFITFQRKSSCGYERGSLLQYTTSVILSMSRQSDRQADRAGSPSPLNKNSVRYRSSGSFTLRTLNYRFPCLSPPPLFFLLAWSHHHPLMFWTWGR